MTIKQMVIDALSKFASKILSLIPKKTSDLTNDSGFIASEKDPTVPVWAKAATKPKYTAAEVGATPTGHTQYFSAISDRESQRIMYFVNNDITNADTLYKSGYYGTKNTCTGMPYKAYWYMVVMNKDPTNQISIQWAMPVSKANNGEVWVRLVRLNAPSTADGNFIGTWERLMTKSYMDEHYYTKEQIDTLLSGGTISEEGV